MKSCTDVRLRAMEPEDLELIYRIENDPTFWRFGTTTVPYSRYVLRQYLASAQNDIFKDEQVRLIIETSNEHGQWHAVGLADLFNFSAQHLRAEVGLAILPEFQHVGLGYAAMQQLLDYAVRLRLHQVYAVIAVSNTPAARLFERLGFSASSCLKDWLLQADSFVDAFVWQKVLIGHRESCHGADLRHET